ncbi:hypothetical protein [Nocardioides terrisoli]|uniref:hypothetical protein n=1 Tax=Nocardioides terrisoli TaxID=3388267 RepID=UPI00287B661E|nr:hypothetical protein [Nocardioides marmorisolisilvae]
MWSVWLPLPRANMKNYGDRAMDNFDEGLRCQDVHSGVRNVDPNSPVLQPLVDTRIVGMAATVAGLIRGNDVIKDAQALMSIAASQLDVDMLAFNEVVTLLGDAGFVSGIQRSGGKIQTFTENVPYYDDLYTRLGEVWQDRNPTELEKQLLVVVDGLSEAPVPLEELESTFALDHADVPLIVQLAMDSGLMQKVQAIDGDIVYSPFFGFENPALLGELVNSHGGDQLAEEFAAVRAKQGLAISPTTHPLLTDAVAKGLIMAPAVTVPGGGAQPFAALPYIADRKLLTARKPVLDKALAVIACLRCAESFGGYSSLDAAGLINVIDKLLDPNRGFLAPHSGHKRQYELMRNARLIEFAPDTLPGGRWVTPRFIDTADNREVLKLARELLTHGELVEHRVDDALARETLASDRSYVAPMQTVHRLRKSVQPSAKQFDKIFEAAMGTRSL